jgi:hypothetical protein
MSNGIAPSEIIVKLIAIGALRGDVVRKRRTPMRFSLIGAVLPALVFCSVAMAQVDGLFDGTVTPTPLVGATSPLGIVASPTGIPLGSTEITSPGVSPLPAGVTGTITVPTTTTSTACPTVATPPAEMFGSTASFDGGGMSAGTAAPATAVNSGAAAMSGTATGTFTSLTASVTSEMPVTSGSSGVLDTSGMSGMCGAGSSSVAASSSPTSTTPTTPGGGTQTGIPFGAYEIGNLGVGSTPPVPLPSVSPIVGTLGQNSPIPTLPTVSPGSATISPTTTTNPACAPTAGGTARTTGMYGIRPMTAPEQLLSQFFQCEREP